jgi:flagellar protein FliL
MSDANETAAAPEAAPAKKKRKLPIILVAAAVLLAGAGGAFYFLKSAAASEKGKAAKAKEADDSDEGEEEEAAESPAEKAGDGAEDGKGSEGKGGAKAKSPKPSLPKDDAVKSVLELQPFIVNLADTEEARYLRLTVSVGLEGEGGEEKPDAIFTTRVRNALLAVLTTKTSGQILTVEGKEQLRAELLKAARAASKQPRVEAIYITDFIVQL